MTHRLGYWLRQQGDVRPGLPERGYWHKDKVEIATKVAAEDTERDCVIRKADFPKGLVGGEQHSHKEIQQVAGIPETDKLHSLELWELFPWIPFSSIMFCRLWVTLSVQWVNSQQLLHQWRVFQCSAATEKDARTFWKSAVPCYGRTHFVLFAPKFSFTPILGFGAFLQCTSFIFTPPGCIVGVL